jgi:hypothetical protein
MPMSPRTLRPGTSFNPRSIPGLAVWIDPSDAATVTLNGSQISAIADKSGNGRSYINAVSANQPLAGTFNGRPAININTNQKWLQSDFSLPLTSQTVFCVAVADATNAAFARLYSQADAGGETPAGAYIPLIRNASTTPPQMSSYTTGFFAPASFSLSTTTVFVARHSGSQHIVRANGAQSVAVSNTLNITFTRHRIGNGFSGADGFVGLIGETLMWPRSLTVAETSAVERWLASRWGAALA